MQAVLVIVNIIIIVTESGPRAESRWLGQRSQAAAPAPTPAAHPPPFSLDPIESENNEPAPVSVFSPDNQGRVKKERKKRKESETKLFPSGRKKSHLEARGAAVVGRPWCRV